MRNVSSTNLNQNFLIEIGVRILLFIIFKITDDGVPFNRRIQPEEVWLYRFPHSEDLIHAETVHFWNVVIAVLVAWIMFRINKNWNEAVASLLGVSMSILVSITVANMLKLVIGRPRPDFFERCFPDSHSAPTDIVELAHADCNGHEDVVLQGRKSFPSGHSALAFGGMAYLSFYLAWSLKLFQQPQQRFPCLRLLAFLTPLLLALMVAASRTCDYHHHWQDVTVGSLIGILVSYICYRQGFPSFLDQMDKNKHMVLTSPPPRDFGSLTGVQTF